MVDSSDSYTQSSISTLIERVGRLEEAAVISEIKNRRLRRSLAGVAVSAGFLFVGVASAITSSGINLTQFMNFSSATVPVPPLDTSVRWARHDPPTLEAGYTNQLLSLISESSQTNSYTWPLYIQLAATDSPSATQLTSQSTGATVRAFQRSTGSPWVSGYHSELFHGLNGLGGPTVATNGTSILFNGELTRKASTGKTIGLNLQNTIGSAGQGTHAIQIQPGPMGWSNGIYFEAGGTGNIGINYDQASFGMGIDLGNNSLRMNADQKVVLEAFGQVFIRYNSSNGRVEIVKGGSTVVASW